MNISIHKAKLEEFEKLIELEIINHSKADIATLREKIAKKFSQIAQNERVIIFAEDNGKIVGSGQIELIQPNPERADGKTVANLEGLLVDKNFRENGIGKQIVTALEQAARERGFARLTLGFNHGPSYDKLYRFYTNLGYSFWKEKPDSPTVIFQKTL